MKTLPLKGQQSELQDKLCSSSRLRLITVLIVILLSLNSLRFGSQLGSLIDTSRIVKKNSTTAENDFTEGELAHAYLLNTTARNYTWTDNRWEPPANSPYMVPRELNHLFRSENTLWLGDSTARQDYMTMYEIIKLDASYNATISLDLPRNPLDKRSVINKGKRGRETFHCPARRDPTPDNWRFKDLGQIPGTDQGCWTNITTATNVTNVTWSDFALNQKPGKFDLFGASCFKQSILAIEEYKEVIEREYSILIVSVGMWEVAGRCNGQGRPLVDLLETLRELSGPSLFIIWKIHGPHGKRAQKMLQIDQEVANKTRDWFAEKEPPYMDLADFGWAIRERSFGSDRINGDLLPHWGLEARLLSIELVSHIVSRKQKRRKANS